ncbi:OpgC protein [Roseivivax jejudonensis]|uniref:OpgC protein n=1 Tax=Roseivivax jejudonensis TaxID=1529041 RepID=A0A1X6Z5N9_9RHOB|nr:OpgC domain-containing protein [Roseivivax jejudonensis]SLN40974.1 OpgC protein [Roseivivax jejudonensis]
MRLTLLDGFRGFFLLFMMIAHTTGQFWSIPGFYNHHALGFVEDAQGFVFISGFVVGLVYTKLMDKRGAAGMRTGVLRRIRTIYTYQAAMILGFAGAAVGLAAWGMTPGVLGQYLDAPFAFTLASLGLVTGSMHLGILALYIWMMLLTPLALVAFARGHARWVFGLSVAAWLLAQTGWPDAAQRPIEAGLASAGAPINIGIYFNVFGWQAIYFFALWLGFLFARDRFDPAWMRTPRARLAFWAALGGVVAFALFDRALNLGWLPDDMRRLAYDRLDRGNMDAIYLANFALDLYVVGWLLNAAPQSGNRVLAAVSRGIEWIFTRRPLVFLGQHSLQVFTAHVVMIYLIMWGMQDRSAGPVVGNLAVLASLMPLYAVAWIHARSVAARKARHTPQPQRDGPALPVAGAATAGR